MGQEKADKSLSFYAQKKYDDAITKDFSLRG